LIAAKYNNVDLELPQFQFGVTNKEASFLQKFPFGKVPALETSDGHHIYESNAISYYVAGSKKDTILFGNGSNADRAQIEQYVNLADNELLPAVATWLYPILGFIPYNKQNTEKAKEDVQKTLAALNNVLASKTYLVGETPTLADIHVVLGLLHLYKMVLEPSFRAPYVNVNRYFLTLVNQPEFKAVLGEVTLAEKMAVYDPKNLPQQNQQSNKQEKQQQQQQPKQQQKKKKRKKKKRKKRKKKKRKKKNQRKKLLKKKKMMMKRKKKNLLRKKKDPIHLINFLLQNSA